MIYADNAVSFWEIVYFLNIWSYSNPKSSFVQPFSLMLILYSFGIAEYHYDWCFFPVRIICGGRTYPAAFIMTIIVIHSEFPRLNRFSITISSFWTTDNLCSWSHIYLEASSIHIIDILFHNAILLDSLLIMMKLAVHKLWVFTFGTLIIISADIFGFKLWMVFDKAVNLL